MFCLCDDMVENDEYGFKDPLVTSCSGQEGEFQEYSYPSMPLLKEQSTENTGKKTLVLDLDETLVHSTFQTTDDSNYIIPVEIEGNIYSVYVYLRPGALEFIERMSSIYEVIVYTASLSIVCRFRVIFICSMLILC